MKGFNQGAVIPQRNLANVIPMRFSLIVGIHAEGPDSEVVYIPESARRAKDSTRGWHGTIISVGAAIPKMKKMVGLIVPGCTCIFDESVSIDDPNRCFDWEGTRYIMMDIETVMGVYVKGKLKMLGDRVLVRKVKKDDYKITKSKLWIPEISQKQDVGGVVELVGQGLWNPTRERYLPVDFKKGDFVLWGKYSGTDIKIRGKDYAVIRQDRILAIVEGETDKVQFA